MTKNLQNEQSEDIKCSTCGKKTLNSAIIFSIAILLICIGSCLSFDLHQTKVISSEILPQMQADYEARIANLNAELELLQIEFNKLKSEHLSLDTLSEEYINDKLADFKENLLNRVPSGNNEQFLQNSAKIAALEEDMSSVKQILKAEQIVPNEVLLASGALTIRSMAENGENFSYEAEVLQIMAQGDGIAEKYTAEIKNFSVLPLENKSTLIADFKRIYNSLDGTKINPNQNDIATNSSETSWKDAFINRIKSLITFKNKGPQIKFDKTPDEVYILVESGNLSAAVKRIKTETKYTALNSPVFEAWMYNVQNYLDFDGAVNGLILHALAQINLNAFNRQNSQGE